MSARAALALELLVEQRRRGRRGATGGEGEGRGVTQLALPFTAREALHCAMRRAGPRMTFKAMDADTARQWDDLMAEIYAGAREGVRRGRDAE